MEYDVVTVGAGPAGLAFAIGANLAQRFRVGPDAFATWAFPQIGFSNQSSIRVYLAARTQPALA